MRSIFYGLIPALLSACGGSLTSSASSSTTVVTGSSQVVTGVGTTTTSTTNAGTGTSSATGSGFLAVVDAHIVDPQGNRVQLHGVNWFGFDNGQTMTDGYYNAGSTPLGGDFATVVERMRLLGFNTIRLPFSFVDLNSAPKPVSMPCTIPTTAQIAASVTPPGQQVPTTVPLLPAPPTAGIACVDSRSHA